MLFGIPMVTGMLITAWATYDHHADLDEEEDHFKASYNITNPIYNLVTGNLGYHTAHHYKQGVHWSKLPELHEKIKHNIPDHCYQSSMWDVFDRNWIIRLFGLST
jgi:fatty acid desaturase